MPKGCSGVPIDGFDLLEHHTRGSLPVQMHLQRLHEAVPDPPTPDYALTLVTSGSCSSGTEVDLGHGRFRHVDPQSVVLSPPDHTNDFRGPGGFDLLIVSFPAQEAEELAAAAGVNRLDLGPLHAGGFRDAELRQIVQALWGESCSRGLRGTLYADGLFTALVARLMLLADTPAPAAPRRARLSPRAVAKVEDLLRDHPEAGLSAEALAEAVGYSRFHFSRLFKEATGTTASKRMIELRVERAKTLLRDHPHWTVAAVACRCGFTDQSHLARHFRHATGTTPAAWRDAL